MKQHCGFLLIELIIGMAIAATVSLVLITALYQANQARATIDDRMYIYSQAAILQAQLERDITTAFAPDMKKVVPEQEENAEESAEKDKKPEDKKSENPEKSDNPEKGDTGTKNSKEKPLKKIFYATQNAENLEQLTCITTSPLMAYWNAKTGSPKARVARVIYRLQKNSDHPESFTLYRQEGQDLAIESYKTDEKNTVTKSIGNYPIVKNIKKCVVTYEVGIEKQPAEQPATTEQTATDTQKTTDKTPTKPEIEYKTFPTWDRENSDANNDNKEATEEDTLPLLPHTVTVEIILQNRTHTREIPFTFVYPIVWRDTTKKRTTKKQPAAPSKIASLFQRNTKRNSDRKFPPRFNPRKKHAHA
jgi:type II secretory pathway component PulJ